MNDKSQSQITLITVSACLLMIGFLLWVALVEAPSERVYRSEESAIRETMRKGYELNVFSEYYRRKTGRLLTCAEFDALIPSLYVGSLEFISKSHLAKHLGPDLDGRGGWIYSESTGRVALNWTNRIPSGGQHCQLFASNIVFYPRVKLVGADPTCRCSELVPDSQRLELSERIMRDAVDFVLDSRKGAPAPRPSTSPN